MKLIEASTLSLKYKSKRLVAEYNFSDQHNADADVDLFIMVRRLLEFYQPGLYRPHLSRRLQDVGN
jgi:hypothetical protein